MRRVFTALVITGILAFSGNVTVGARNRLQRLLAAIIPTALKIDSRYTAQLVEKARYSKRGKSQSLGRLV